VEHQAIIWRLVFAGVATRQELDTHWSLVDVYHAHLALDYQDAVTAWQLENAK
jgi:hypothetical protein